MSGNEAQTEIRKDVQAISVDEGEKSFTVYAGKVLNGQKVSAILTPDEHGNYTVYCYDPRYIMYIDKSRVTRLD